MEQEKEFLLKYRQSDYECPSVTADVAAFMIRTEDKKDYRHNPENKLQLLLIKRGKHPFKDMWALPGGFLHRGETVEECALREIKEETGVMPVSLMSVGIFSEPERDPRGWIISNAYVSVICGESVKQAGADDASDAQWFSVSLERSENGEYHLELAYEDIRLKAVLAEEKSRFGRSEFRIIESGSLAFDHAAIIAAALTALRNEARDFSTILDFMPAEFTLSSVQNVQETILNISVLPANFRRMIRGYVEETDSFVRGQGHRPAKLYRRKL